MRGHQTSPHAVRLEDESGDGYFIDTDTALLALAAGWVEIVAPYVAHPKPPETIASLPLRHAEVSG